MRFLAQDYLDPVTNSLFMLRLDLDRSAPYLAEKSVKRDFVFLLALAANQNAGLCVIPSQEPINVFDRFSASALKFFRRQTKLRA
jgi:hypothetical protein